MVRCGFLTTRQPPCRCQTRSAPFEMTGGLVRFGFSLKRVHPDFGIYTSCSCVMQKEAGCHSALRISHYAAVTLWELDRSARLEMTSGVSAVLFLTKIELILMLEFILPAMLSFSPQFI